jgi:hypothetical protein
VRYRVSIRSAKPPCAIVPHRRTRLLLPNEDGSTPLSIRKLLDGAHGRTTTRWRQSRQAASTGPTRSRARSITPRLTRVECLIADPIASEDLEDGHPKIPSIQGIADLLCCQHRLAHRRASFTIKNNLDSNEAVLETQSPTYPPRFGVPARGASVRPSRRK